MIVSQSARFFCVALQLPDHPEQFAKRQCHPDACARQDEGWTEGRTDG
jgi:hypothetical protein